MSRLYMYSPQAPYRQWVVPWRRWRAYVRERLQLRPDPRDVLVLQRHPDKSRVMANPGEVVAAIQAGIGADRRAWLQVENKSLLIAAALPAQRLAGFFCVTGANGGAWAMFLPDRAAIVEIFADSDSPAHLWNLAETFGLKFFCAWMPWIYRRHEARVVPPEILDGARRLLGGYINETFPAGPARVVSPQELLCEGAGALPVDMSAECGG